MAIQGVRLKVVPISRLYPNPWNFNQLDRRNKIKLKTGMKAVQKEVGELLPILCRPHPTKAKRYQIVDGEHRWEEAKRLGKKKIPILVADFSESLAIKLSSSLNYLKGEKDEVRYWEAMQRQIEEFGETPASLAKMLPEEEDEILEGLAQRISQEEQTISESLESQIEESDSSSAPQDRFLELTFVLPTSAAQLVERAIKEVERGLTGKNTRGRALEYIAADFLQGPGVKENVELPRDRVAGKSKRSSARKNKARRREHSE